MSISRHDYYARFATDPDAEAYWDEVAEARAELRDDEGDPYGWQASRAEDREFGRY